MVFHVEHTTEYLYSEPATESYSEIRLRPRNSLRQEVNRHATVIHPAVMMESYIDYFGNFVETVSIPFRHNKLTVTSLCSVVTAPFQDPLSGLDLTMSEARQLYAPHRRELHDFLRPSHYIHFTEDVQQLACELLPAKAHFTEAILDLNSYIHREFQYEPGSTDVTTNVPEFLQVRKGVCQDFAHLMISLLRHAGVPARYISGYIETDPLPHLTKDETERQMRQGTSLIGATASHAWVEIFTPNQFWVGLDPTNNILEEERHIQIGMGRDYYDVPPVRGIFKGTHAQNLSVRVNVRRSEAHSEVDTERD